MVKLTVLLLVFFILSCAGARSSSKDKFNAPFDGVRFNNIEPFKDKSLLTVLKWRFTAKRKNWQAVKNQTFSKPTAVRSKALKLTMIGHSTVLIQIDNLNILTDPHYSNRSSPVSWAGPKRVIQPAIKFSDLPPIDLVLISHNHYDHLDLPTLKKLSNRFSPLILVGLGNKKLLTSHGIKNVKELDWWEEYLFQDIPIVFTPVQHWSARGLFDKRKTLWGGFAIKGSKNVFFAGDTGYGKVFKMINKKLGKMDVGLIPIGAYEPRWFMRNAHVNPQESVKIFQDLELDRAFGIHFATFKDLTDEDKNRPVSDLKKALKKFSIKEDRFIAPIFGAEYSPYDSY